MAQDLVPDFDPIEETKNNLVSIVFAKSSSSYYTFAVGVAQGADKYREITVGKGIIHAAVFSKTKDQASRAISLIDLVEKWQGAQIFLDGDLAAKEYEHYGAVSNVLKCFSMASSCDDWRAYCFRIEKIMAVQSYIVPCRMIELHLLKNITDLHPSSFRNQFQALSVTKKCHWCPLFKADSFRPVVVQDWLSNRTP